MADNIKIEIKGARELRNKLVRAGSEAGKIMSIALYQEAEKIMSKSKKQVPVDTGALRGTGHVQLPQKLGNNIQVKLGYGGPAAEYAVYVHENLNARHKVGKAKYLEDPALEHARNMGDRLQAKVERALERLMR